MDDVEALILAAGRGERLNGQPKAFLRLGDETLLERVTRLAAEISRSTIVAVPLDETDRANRLVGGVARVIPGGTSRGETFRMLLDTASARSILVLDVVHPFVSHRLCRRVLDAAAASGAAAAVGRPHDQVIRSDATAVAPGQPLFLLQKPIVFELADIRRGITSAAEPAKETSDTYGVLELLDLAAVRVQLVEAEPWNVKLTTEQDWWLIRALAGHVSDTGDPS